MRTGRAFTLVEAMVAFGLLFVALVFVFSMFAATRKGMHMTETHSNAVLLGQSLLSYAREASYVQWQTESTTYTPLPGFSKAQTYSGTDNGALYEQLINYQVTTSPVLSNGSGTEQERVVATMSWKEPAGNETPTHQLVLETLITNLYNP